MKSPFNWVGNKYKFLPQINDIIKDKEYHMVVDLFMGSGNIILNTECISRVKIGNDKQKLLPNLYNTLKLQEIFSSAEIENVLNQYGRFSTKESYYNLRDDWNKKYLSNKFDRSFILETALLLKMCSNSMVRFNPKEGYFNQGFRGLGNKAEFFTEEMKAGIVDNLNLLLIEFQTNKYNFTSKSFREYKDEQTSNRLIIADPPYILRSDMYDTDFTNQDDIFLLQILEATKNKFIYFNYLVRDGIVNLNLQTVLNRNPKWTIVDINDKAMSGQGRSENIKEVREVIITNV